MQHLPATDLLGKLCWQAHHEDVAKLVSSTQSVIVKLQLRGEVAGRGVICIDVQLVLSLLVLHEEDGFLGVSYIDAVPHDRQTCYVGWQPAQ